MNAFEQLKFYVTGEEAVLGEGDPSYVLLVGTGLAFGAAISGAMQNVLIARLSLVGHCVQIYLGIYCVFIMA